MISLRKSHLHGNTPEWPWEFGASGDQYAYNNFVIYPSDALQSECFRLTRNNELFIPTLNASNCNASNCNASNVSTDL